jgi:uncharacterized repeat protein (TIGR01451 family)
VQLTNTIPVTSSFVSATASTGSATTNASGAVVWTLGNLAKDAVATATVVVKPGTVGTVVGSSTVLGTESDPNTGNNLVAVTNTVVSPVADLAVSVEDAPDPIYISASNHLTYTITVQNLGPATANAVAVTNTLPGAVSFLWATPTNSYKVAGSVITFTNLGNLGSGGQFEAKIVVRAATSATLTNTTTVGSAVTDPLKGNNTTSVKTVVDYPQITVSSAGGNLTIAWPAEAGNYILERATSLTPPVIWTVVTTPAPQVVGDQRVLTLPIGSGNEFFRLRAPGP